MSNDPDNFYVPDLFDFVFQDCNAANDRSNPSKYLHLNGTLSSEAWLDYLKKNPILDQPSDDSFDVLRFGSIETFRIDTPLQDIPDIVVKELLSLPSELVTLCPTAALTHDTSFSHLLRNSNSNAKTIDPDKPGTFILLIDSGCSVSCSGFKEDFHGQLAIGDFGHVNTADGQAKIEGFGMLRWDVLSTAGERLTILVPGYYAPTVKMRLLSPQDYCRYHHFDPNDHAYRGSSDWMSIDVRKSETSHETAEVIAHIDQATRLPFIFAELGHHDIVNGNMESRCHCNVASIYDIRNINLMDAQRKLKLDHDRLAHLSMKMIQKLYQPEDLHSPDFDGQSTSSDPCLLAKDSSQLRCSPPMCEACELAKARKRPTGFSKTVPRPEVKDIIRADDLSPGNQVSVDQYESSVRGRRLETKGREKFEHRYCGGALFYDHASGKISVYHQVSLSAHETLQSKQAFERDALLCGFKVSKYRTDNGIFTSKAYEDSLEETQSTTRSAVGAHHQNGVAESNIGKVQRMARTLLLHLRLHWPDEFSPDLWPFALDYAVYIYNHVPRGGKPGSPSPMEVFCGTKIGCRPLRRLRVFGCPSYVLDPRLQDGKKIPKWEPRSRKGQFLGFSKSHASTVGLIRNIRTGYISPQFHVVYDEEFTTVTSVAQIDLDEQWIDLFLNSRESYIEGHDETADGPLPPLDPDYMPEDVTPSTPTVPTRRSSTSSQELPSVVSQNEQPSTSQGEQPSTRQGEPDVTQQGEPVVSLPDPQDDQVIDTRGVGWHDVEEAPPREVPETSEPTPASPFSPRRSSRTRRSRDDWSEPPLTYKTKGGNASVLRKVVSRLFTYTVLSTCPNVIAAATLDWNTVSSDPEFIYFDRMFRAQLDPVTAELFCPDEAFHPFAFASKVQSEDFPSYQEILQMPDDERKKWIESMDVEMQDLVDRNAFELVPRSTATDAGQRVIKSKWAFRRKRRPDNTISRYKSRLVVRGDTQRQFYDFSTNETFAPVVEWSTVRMLFSLGVMNN